MKKIILASASPRRKELLESINLKFEIIPSATDENIEGKSFSYELIEQLAFEKANDVALKANYPALIIGSDTVVVIDNQILGKPKDKSDAKKMLRMLSANTHIVVTAIAIIDTENKKQLIESVTSKVTFKSLSDKEIEDYVNSGEPMDKAGAYGIQGLANIFVESIEGCYNNIVGLSTNRLAQMLKEFDI